LHCRRRYGGEIAGGAYSVKTMGYLRARNQYPSGGKAHFAVSIGVRIRTSRLGYRCLRTASESVTIRQASMAAP
jgi:hypothetical protein